MHAEMMSLREENRKLRSTCDDLEEENLELKDSVAEQDINREDFHLHVIQEHYRYLAKHQSALHDAEVEEVQRSQKDFGKQEITC